MSAYRRGAVVEELRPSSWWQRLLCRRGWCFKELVWIEELWTADVWHHRCPYCGAESSAVDDPL